MAFAVNLRVVKFPNPPVKSLTSKDFTRRGQKRVQQQQYSQICRQTWYLKKIQL